MSNNNLSPIKESILHIWNAFGYSIEGLQVAVKEESAFRIELVVGSIMILIALFLPISFLGTSLMIASVLFVYVMELLNSAIEAVVDRVSMERHPLSKKAKDLGSAAVAISIFNVAVVWAGVLLEHFVG